MIEFTVAVEGALLVHTPPEVVLVKIVVEPTQALFVPAIAASVGSALTLTIT